jgi:hypothetical protein
LGRAWSWVEVYWIALAVVLLGVLAVIGAAYLAWDSR